MHSNPNQLAIDNIKIIMSQILHTYLLLRVNNKPI